MKSKKNILFVDSWALGIKFMSPLAQVLSKKHNVYLLHFNSLKSKSSLQTKSIIKKFEKEEFKKYKPIFSGIIDCKKFNYSVQKAYNSINPDIIISISLHGFEHRYFNQIACLNNIPSIMYMHGLRGMDNNINLSTYTNKFFKKLKSVFYYSRLYFYYLKDLKRNNQQLRFYYHFKRYLKLIISHYQFINSPKKDIGINYHTIHVTSQNDIHYYLENYGITKKNTIFKIIGHIDYTDLIEYIQTINNINPTNKILFVSQPLTKDKVISKKEFEIAIKTSKEISEILNLELIVRPHPRDDFEFLSFLKEKYDFQLSDNDLAKDIVCSKLLIGFNSTVLFSAQLLKKPLLLFDVPTYPLHPALKNYSESIIISSFDVDNKIPIKTINEKINAYNPPKIEDIIIQNPVKIIENTINQIICCD